MRVIGHPTIKSVTGIWFFLLLLSTIQLTANEVEDELEDVRAALITANAVSENVRHPLKADGTLSQPMVFSFWTISGLESLDSLYEAIARETWEHSALPHYNWEGIANGLLSDTPGKGLEYYEQTGNPPRRHYLVFNNDRLIFNEDQIVHYMSVNSFLGITTKRVETDLGTTILKVRPPPKPATTPPGPIMVLSYPFMMKFRKYFLTDWGTETYHPAEPTIEIWSNTRGTYGTYLDQRPQRALATLAGLETLMGKANEITSIEHSKVDDLLGDQRLAGENQISFFAKDHYKPNYFFNLMNRLRNEFLFIAYTHLKSLPQDSPEAAAMWAFIKLFKYQESATEQLTRLFLAEGYFEDPTRKAQIIRSYYSRFYSDTSYLLGTLREAMLTVHPQDLDKAFSSFQTVAAIDAASISSDNPLAQSAPTKANPRYVALLYRNHLAFEIMPIKSEKDLVRLVSLPQLRNIIARHTAKPQYELPDNVAPPPHKILVNYNRLVSLLGKADLSNQDIEAFREVETFFLGVSESYFDPEHVVEKFKRNPPSALANRLLGEELEVSLHGARPNEPVRTIQEPADIDTPFSDLGHDPDLMVLAAVAYAHIRTFLPEADRKSHDGIYAEQLPKALAFKRFIAHPEYLERLTKDDVFDFTQLRMDAVNIAKDISIPTPGEYIGHERDIFKGSIPTGESFAYLEYGDQGEADRRRFSPLRRALFDLREAGVVRGESDLNFVALLFGLYGSGNARMVNYEVNPWTVGETTFDLPSFTMELKDPRTGKAIDSTLRIGLDPKHFGILNKIPIRAGVDPDAQKENAAAFGPSRKALVKYFARHTDIAQDLGKTVSPDLDGLLIEENPKGGELRWHLTRYWIFDRPFGVERGWRDAEAPAIRDKTAKIMLDATNRAVDAVRAVIELGPVLFPEVMGDPLMSQATLEQVIRLSQKVSFDESRALSKRMIAMRKPIGQLYLSKLTASERNVALPHGLTVADFITAWINGQDLAPTKADLSPEELTVIQNVFTTAYEQLIEELKDSTTVASLHEDLYGHPEILQALRRDFLEQLHDWELDTHQDFFPNGRVSVDFFPDSFYRGIIIPMEEQRLRIMRTIDRWPAENDLSREATIEEFNSLQLEARKQILQAPELITWVLPTDPQPESDGKKRARYPRPITLSEHEQPIQDNLIREAGELRKFLVDHASNTAFSTMKQPRALEFLVCTPSSCLNLPDRAVFNTTPPQDAIVSMFRPYFSLELQWLRTLTDITGRPLPDVQHIDLRNGQCIESICKSTHFGVGPAMCGLTLAQNLSAIDPDRETLERRLGEILSAPTEHFLELDEFEEAIQNDQINGHFKGILRAVLADLRQNREARIKTLRDFVSILNEASIAYQASREELTPTIFEMTDAELNKRLEALMAPFETRISPLLNGMRRILFTAQFLDAVKAGLRTHSGPFVKSGPLSDTEQRLKNEILEAYHYHYE